MGPRPEAIDDVVDVDTSALAGGGAVTFLTRDEDQVDAARREGLRVR